MRTLTITRNKSFVGCMGKFKIYIEDHDAPELTILDTPCRKLGTIKNGKTLSFEITEAAAKVFVIAGKSSKGYCNEYYPLPAGNEDVALTGQSRFNPANGNAFRFDGVTDEAVLANRRKGSSKGLIVLAVALVVGFIIGCVIGILPYLGSTPETFTGNGYSITLTDKFSKGEGGMFQTVYESKNAVVILYQEPFFASPEVQNMTPGDYAENMRRNMSYSSTDVTTTSDGLTYFDYTATSGAYSLTYRVFVFKSSDCMWTVQFSTETKNADKMESDIMEWARSFTTN